MTEQRKKFEEWFKRELGTDALGRDPYNPDEYDHIGAYFAWHGWQAAIDAALQSTWPEDASDYASRIAVIGQNGEETP